MNRICSALIDFYCYQWQKKLYHSSSMPPNEIVLCYIILQRKVDLKIQYFTNEPSQNKFAPVFEKVKTHFKKNKSG